MTSQIFLGNCEEELKNLPDNSIDSVVTDPPYELGFMGKSWDSTGIAYNVDMWGEVFRVLKPGGYLLSFGGSRTYHRMACAIEDAGFEIRDQIMWLYGSGFPKSLNLSKAIESTILNGSSHSTALRKTEQDGDGDNYQLTGKNNGILGETRVYDRKVFSPSTTEAQEWEGWGTALKPAHEPIVMARKPLSEKTVAKNVLEHGTGGINIDGSRIGTEVRTYGEMSANQPEVGTFRDDNWVPKDIEVTVSGRWPANVVHDGLEEEWSRYFYSAKASKKDKNEGLEDFANSHPTVKPTELMRYLVRMVTPPDGTVLDPFTGSGSTGKAAVLEGFNFIGVEQNPEYIKIAEARIKVVENT